MRRIRPIGTKEVSISAVSYTHLCTIIKKGEVYESHLFTVKDDRFKSESFLREVKEVYTELINRHISDPEQQLKVFDKNSVYLPTKKIGKNNPKAEEIAADNATRQEWNRTADVYKRQTYILIGNRVQIGGINSYRYYP